MKISVGFGVYKKSRTQSARYGCSDDLHSALRLSVVTQRDAPLGHYEARNEQSSKEQSANGIAERIRRNKFRKGEEGEEGIMEDRKRRKRREDKED